jgi:hypothetical chaperone protein
MPPDTGRPVPCGLDFGTSNSTLGIAAAGGARLVHLEGDNVAVPSAMFFGAEAATGFLIGREAVAAYVDGLAGRLMRSLKSILGSSLIEEKTQLFRKRVAFADIIGLYVAELKRRAEQASGALLEAVVMGRPVHFVDGDADADRAAEDVLRRIAVAAGFRDVSFQFEPIAAAHAYEREIASERIVLVADIGGGTSDFTLARLRPGGGARDDRERDILGTGGIRLGGTDYDTALAMAVIAPHLGYRSLLARGDLDLPSGPFFELCTWSTAHRLYDPKALNGIREIRRMAARPELLDRFITVIERRRAHSVLMEAEAAKIALSAAASRACDLGWIEPGLAATATLATFEAATAARYERLRAAAADCLRTAGVSPSAVQTVFFTGGASAIPSVRRAVLQGFPDAEAADGDRFGSVGLGLAIESGRRYG